ncbi:aminopeptidase N-like [Chironomus tepperi]|uniref:aminopeptidase N-like n=1 Tax=Chironomus tepperi TaxID=113505 RepID=UPI00391F4A4B
MWQKVAVLSVFLIISVVRGNPLHNDGIEESKFGVPGRFNKVLEVDVPTTYRLPNDSYPISYDIFLVTNIHKGEFDFDGHVMIKTKIVESTDRITLHYRQIEILQVSTFIAEPLTPIDGNATFTLIPSHEFLVIDLSRTYDVGTELLLHVQYKGKLRDDGAGFYWGAYNNSAGETKFYGATQFEVTDARHAFPCYDEPGIRAIMTLSIVHDKNFTAIANTDVLVEEDEQDNMVITTFQPTPVMQTYLLAFAISDYEYVDAVNTRIPQRIFATPMAIENGHADFAATVVGPILHKLDEILGVKYPLSKMDHIALTKFNFGAMENFGLITYIERGILLNPALSESAKYNQQNSIISLVTHEFAHQWFGDIISPKWWQYTWLNEGFATLFANYIPSLVYPQRGAMRGFFSSTIQTAFNADGPTAWAMNHYTEQPNELWSKFGGIGYQKSGCVLRMFMEVMTEPVFLKGLNYYLTANYMKAATPTELHTGLQKAYDEEFPEKPLNVGDLMYTWENQAGYPLLTVRTGKNTTVFSQNRYPLSNGEVYSIPITFASKSNPDFSVKTPKLWLNVPTFGFTTEYTGYTDGDWMVVNIDQVGYYRVDYGIPLWKANIAQLMNDHTVINPLNRALLLDEFYLGWTQFRRVYGIDAINILSYMGKEDEYLAWARGARIFNDLRSHLFDTLVHEHFNEFIRQITKPHLDVLGYEGFDGEDANRASLRSYVKQWSCQAYDGNCFLQEYQKFLNFYNAGARGTANFDYCFAMRLIDETTFGQLLAIVVSDKSFPNRARYIQYLGCSLNEENIKKLLKVTLDAGNNLISDERQAILISVYSNSRYGLTQAFSFLDDNYLKLHRLFDLTAVIDNLAGYMNTQRSADKIFALANKLQAANIITGTQAIVAKVGEMEKWIDTNIFEILDYFGVEVPTTEPTTPTTSGPTTTDSSSPSTSTPSSTTPSPSTTPGAAQSVFVSISLIAFCVIATVMKSF